jgi:hypothetical protein
MWQNFALVGLAGWVGHLTWVRELARRRSGRTIREAVLPARKKPERVPDVTEVA